MGAKQHSPLMQFEFPMCPGKLFSQPSQVYLSFEAIKNIVTEVIDRFSAGAGIGNWASSSQVRPIQRQNPRAVDEVLESKGRSVRCRVDAPSSTLLILSTLGIHLPFVVPPRQVVDSLCRRSSRPIVPPRSER